MIGRDGLVSLNICLNPTQFGITAVVNKHVDKYLTFMQTFLKKAWVVAQQKKQHSLSGKERHPSSVNHEDSHLQ